VNLWIIYSIYRRLTVTKAVTRCRTVEIVKKPSRLLTKAARARRANALVSDVLYTPINRFARKKRKMKKKTVFQL